MEEIKIEEAAQDTLQVSNEVLSNTECNRRVCLNNTACNRRVSLNNTVCNSRVSLRAVLLWQAIVVFHSAAQAKRVLALHTKASKETSAPLFRGEAKIKVNRAPMPREIRWEHQQVDPMQTGGLMD